MTLRETSRSLRPVGAPWASPEAVPAAAAINNVTKAVGSDVRRLGDP
jgi:hypothetical protein